MAKTTYGFTALMEAVNNELRSNTVLSDIHEAVNESASFLDIGEDFIGKTEVEQDIDVSDDYISPEEDAKLEKMLDKIEPTGDTDDDVSEEEIASLEASLESYLEEEEGL